MPTLQSVNFPRTCGYECPPYNLLTFPEPVGMNTHPTVLFVQYFVGWGFNPTRYVNPRFIRVGINAHPTIC